MKVRDHSIESFKVNKKLFSNRVRIPRGIPIGPTKLQLLSISSDDTDYFIIQIHSAMRISILPDFFGDGIPDALLHILVAVC
jgi:hypothetical protein